MIRENLDEVRAKVAAAAVRSGRDPKDITLIAVSKTKPVPMLLEAYGAGARDFGENKVQEILDKHPQMPQDVRWHMIGHLQRNKVRQVLGKAVLIHSVDSIRLAEQIEAEAAKQNLTADILLEVNVAREESKYGFMTEEVMDAVLTVSRFPHVRIRGLMTIAPFVEILKKIEKFLKNYFNYLLTSKVKTLIMLI